MTCSLCFDIQRLKYFAKYKLYCCHLQVYWGPLQVFTKTFCTQKFSKKNHSIVYKYSILTDILYNVLGRWRNILVFAKFCSSLTWIKNLNHSKELLEVIWILNVLCYARIVITVWHKWVCYPSHWCSGTILLAPWDEWQISQSFHGKTPRLPFKFCDLRACLFIYLLIYLFILFIYVFF